jgi:hypothetical protein
MDRITPRELVRPSIVDERGALDLQALAFLVAAVLTGVFVILFLWPSSRGSCPVR